jgi:hypothetical protein
MIVSFLGATERVDVLDIKQDLHSIVEELSTYDDREANAYCRSARTSVLVRQLKCAERSNLCSLRTVCQHLLCHSGLIVCCDPTNTYEGARIHLVNALRPNLV